MKKIILKLYFLPFFNFLTGLVQKNTHYIHITNIYYFLYINLSLLLLDRSAIDRIL